MENNCIFCKKQLPKVSNIVFCPYCTKQLKCKNCNESLILDAKGCISCGTPILETTSSSTLNQIEFEQKGDFKKFKATFSDNIGHELVTTFGGMVGGNSVKKSLLSSFGTSTALLKAQPSESIQEASVIGKEEEVSEALSRLLKLDGEKLIFQTSSFKEQNKLDKEVRMALLAILGHDYLKNQPKIKRATLTEMLKKSKLATSGFRAWIIKCEEILTLSDGFIELTPKGKEAALGVLAEIMNPNVTTGQIAISKVGGQKRSKKGVSDQTSSSNKTAKAPKEFLNKIIAAGYFTERRTLSDIIDHLKLDHASTFKSNAISGHMGKYVKKGILQRVNGPNGYEYFNK